MTESLHAAPPATAAWQHHGARSGFEVVYFGSLAGGLQVEGWTTALEVDQTWAVHYTIELDQTWATRTARVLGRSTSGSRSILLETDDHGHWLIDGEAATHLDGCLDVDLESSAMTNAFPIHRLRLPVGTSASLSCRIHTRWRSRGPTTRANLHSCSGQRVRSVLRVHSSSI